jgi:hypothetical protein
MFETISSERWRADQSEREFISELKEKAATKYEFFVGVDIGKLQDRSAIAVIERRTQATDTGPIVQTALRGLYRVPSQVSYVRQAEGIESLLTAPCFQLWGANIYLDASGVGEACADMLHERGKLKFKRVNITSGDAISAKRGRIYASRNALISGFVKLLRRGDLIISADLPLLSDLLRELESLGEETSKGGASVYRTTGHDDLIIAFSLAALAMQRKDTGIKTGVRPLF